MHRAEVVLGHLRPRPTAGAVPAPSPSPSPAPKMATPVTSHVLDTHAGRPARGLPVTFSCLEDGTWKALSKNVTNADGRCPGIVPEDFDFQPGTYMMRFETKVYFDAQGYEGFYPHVEIVFVVRDATQHFHVPLLLSANGYSTYRGS